MQAVLIYTDTQAIANQKLALNNMVPYIQQVYNEFKAVGVIVTLEDLRPILYSALRYDVPTETQIESFVKNYLVTKAGNQSFNGVPVDIEALIQIPDLTNLVAKINYYYQIASGDIGYRPEYLIINNDVVTKTPTAFATIEEKFTYYSQNDRGAEVATKLFSLAQQLNEVRLYLGIDPFSNQYRHKVYGLELHGGDYRPDLNFIRQQEDTYASYVAP